MNTKNSTLIETLNESYKNYQAANDSNCSQNVFENAANAFYTAEEEVVALLNTLTDNTPETVEILEAVETFNPDYGTDLYKASIAAYMRIDFEA